MTQNTEQYVRTREEQVKEVLIDRYDERLVFTEASLTALLDQAEARGAAEQRRKDAEGQEPFAYVDPADIEQPFVRLGSADIEIRKTAAWSYTQPIYTRPANVAALEADATRYRIVRQRFLEDARDRGESLTPTQFDEKVDGDTQARAALTREGGV